MGALGALLKWLVLLPILLAILLLAIANGQMVVVHLNPFDTGDPVLRVNLPLYQVAFLVFALGAIVGGLVAWAGRRRHRTVVHSRDDAPRQGRAEAQARADFLRPGDGRPASNAAAYLPRPERS